MLDHHYPSFELNFEEVMEGVERQGRRPVDEMPSHTLTLCVVGQISPSLAFSLSDLN